MRIARAYSYAASVRLKRRSASGTQMASSSTHHSASDPRSLPAVPRVAVLGPGGVGGLVAAALHRAGTHVTVIAREQTAQLIAARGIAVRSAALGDFSACPPASAELSEPVDYLLIATKATGLEAALDRVQAPPRLVIPLLNGLEHMEPLRARFGSDAVVAGVIRVESDRPAAGEIVQTSPSIRIDLATKAQPVIAIAALIERTGIEVTEPGIASDRCCGPSSRGSTRSR